MTDYIDIDGLRFYGDVDGAQSGWVYESLQGWYSSPPMRGALADRPTGDGAFGITRAYRSARPLKFIGSLFADTTVAAIRDLWARFAAIQSSGALFPITVTDDFGALTCLVTLNGQASVTEAIGDDGQSLARVEATFLAPDPIKYAAQRTVNTGVAVGGGGLVYPLHDPAGALSYGANGTLGRVVLTNSGTATVWPSLRVTGPFPSGFFVQRIDTGQVVRYDRVVPDGSTVTINFRTGEVLIDGLSDGSTYLTRYEFFSVGPGASVEVQLNPIAGGTGFVDFYISDGFW